MGQKGVSANSPDLRNRSVLGLVWRIYDDFGYFNCEPELLVWRFPVMQTIDQRAELELEELRILEHEKLRLHERKVRPGFPFPDMAIHLFW